MTPPETLAEKHSRLKDAQFQLKSFLLVLRRHFRNLVHPVKKYTDQRVWENAPVIGRSDSELWNTDDHELNWILTAGKVENLRIAVRRIHGIEVPAGKTFSFWKHIGNPNLGKGYMTGREIREGCIIPTKAGGLCQLSNALYDAAMKAGFGIIERHKHSKVIKGSLAEQNRDATVKWNYVDLRFRSEQGFRIEAILTGEKLIVTFKSRNDLPEKNEGSKEVMVSSHLNDCYSCGNHQCFKHPTGITPKKKETITTFILDEKWKEQDDYIKEIVQPQDHFILPAYKHPFIRSHRFVWKAVSTHIVKSTPIKTIHRAIGVRVAARTGKNIFSTQLKYDKKIALAMAKKIPAACTHLVISQNLLPYLWDQGIMGGRSFDVIMTRLPMEKLHQRLDEAYQKHPESKTLHDFRAPEKLVESENEALTRARKIITPHYEIASIFIHKSVHLSWYIPGIKNPQKGDGILFPASAVGRKGAYEIRKAARDLGLKIIVTGAVKEKENFWEGIHTSSSEADPLEGVGLLVYPTYIEHQPRLLLRALAEGIPVITTPASGLMPGKNIFFVPAGDDDALKKAIEFYHVTSSPEPVV